MENVARETSRVKSATATKIPQVRATPLKKVSDIRERLERERTFTVEEATPPQSPQVLLRQRPQRRRQWASFDRGGGAAKSDVEEEADDGGSEDVFRKVDNRMSFRF